MGKYYYAGIINIKECMAVGRDNAMQQKKGVLWVVVQIKYNTAHLSYVQINKLSPGIYVSRKTDI